MKSVPLLLALTLSAACMRVAPPDAAEPARVEPGEVEIELAGPGEAAVVVPVLINGEGPYEMVLDTGATITCVDRPLADQLGLEEREGMKAIGSTVASTGAIRLVSVDSLAVGDARAEDLTACTLDLSQLQNVGFEARGLLGLNFLKNYVMTLDFERRALRLEVPSGDEERRERP